MPQRKGGRRKKGGSLSSTLVKKVANTAGKLNKLAKDTKIISNALGFAGMNKLSNTIGSLGYGRRKRRTRRKRRGGSIAGDILGGIVGVPLGGIMGAASGVYGSVKGLGRSQRGGMWMRAGDPVSRRFTRMY